MNAGNLQLKVVFTQSKFTLKHEAISIVTKPEELKLQ